MSLKRRDIIAWLLFLTAALLIVMLVRKNNSDWFFVAPCLLAATGVFLLWQKQPFLGPDGACLFTPLLFWMPMVRSEPDYLFAVFLLLLAQLCLRELVGWVFHRCRLDWCASVRLADRFKSSTRKMALFFGFLFLPMIGLLLLTQYNMTQSWWIPPAAFLTVSIVLTVICLLRRGKELDHLRTQIDCLGEDKALEPWDGAFSEAERKLWTIQIEHREAVARAVADERFRVDLIANVSHDLRTPLTAILGYGELLEKQTMSEEGKTQLSKLNRKAVYMRDLVDSLFELTKVSSGVLEPKQEPIDLVRLLEQTVGFFDDQLSAAGLTVKRQFAFQAAPLNSDGTMLHQVFSNLLSNAIKYALQGTRIYLELTKAEENYLVRMVNTASYEMDFTAEEIVQRFARGDKARSTQGSGLGLTIAQTYTEALGGKFEIVIDGDQFNALVTLPKTERNL